MLRPFVLTLAIAIAGCAGSQSSQKGQSGMPADSVPSADRLVLDMSMGPSTEKRPGEAFDEAIRMYERIAGSAKVVRRSDQQLVLDADWAKMHNAMGGGEQVMKGPMPMRFVFDRTEKGSGMVEVRQRMYYTGDDPAMAQRLRDGYKGSPLESNTSPRH